MSNRIGYNRLIYRDFKVTEPVEEPPIYFNGKRIKVVTDCKQHLACLPYSLPALHHVAKELGIARRYFQKNHYVIPIKLIPSIYLRVDTIMRNHVFRRALHISKHKHYFKDWQKPRQFKHRIIDPRKL